MLMLVKNIIHSNLKSQRKKIIYSNGTSIDYNKLSYIYLYFKVEP